MSKFIWWLAVCFLLSIASPMLGSDPEIKDQFLRDYSTHGEALQKHYSNVRVKYSLTQPLPKGRSRTSTIEGMFTKDSYILRASSYSSDDKGKRLGTGELAGSVDARNQRYRFDLQSPPTGPYVLSNVTIFDSSTALRAFRPLSKMSVPLADPIRAMTFTELAKDGNTKFLVYRQTTWQNKLAMELTVQYEYAATPTEPASSSKKEFYFSPKDSWVCVGQKWHSADIGGRYTEEIYSYEKPANEIPTLKRIEQWSRNPRKRDEERIIFFVDIEEYAPVPPIPDEEFRLTKFGFPEPEGIIWEKPTSRRYLWFLLAGGVSLALGFLFFRRRARAAKR